ncbi:hypothetical protein [Nocardia sp. NPDC047038]|uniref:hypothetical protein n=1 Tax=Nocardia sp. NPDC047038 TaxID=3154338 RepID=UPI0033C656A3
MTGLDINLDSCLVRRQPVILDSTPAEDHVRTTYMDVIDAVQRDVVTGMDALFE